MVENTNGSNQPEIKQYEISNDIKLFQRKLSDLIKPYSRPLSSIVPEERQLEQSLLFNGVDIDAYYDRLSAWEGSISKK